MTSSVCAEVWPLYKLVLLFVFLPVCVPKCMFACCHKPRVAPSPSILCYKKTPKGMAKIFQTCKGKMRNCGQIGMKVKYFIHPRVVHPQHSLYMCRKGYCSCLVCV